MTGTGLVNAQGKDGTGVSSTSKLQVGVPAYLAVKLTVVASRIVTELFVNGVSQGTGTTTTATYSATTQTISQVDLELKLPPAASNVVFSHLSHTTYPVNESAAASGVTEAQALAGLASTVQGFTLATLPAGLSGAPLAAISGGSGSTLDQMNTIIRTEQGAIYTTTSGTITSPTQTVTIRERTRPSTVTYSFDLERELQDAPDFVRDITNMVSSVTASGPTQSVIVYNSAYVARVGSKNTSDTISNRDAGDLTLWAQDRLLRGANVALRAVSFTVDAMTTPTDRSADLLAMVPGDRIRVTNLPNTQLGFTTWDGWLLGVNESHSLTEHTFTIYLQPVLPATGIFDTDLWANGGNNTISTALTSVATSMVVTSADLITFFEQVTFPYTLLIESEQVTVSACTAPAAGVQTLTIARAANGTTAAAHAISVTPEVLPATNIFAF
jgi:hypothetical protein